VRVFAVRDIKFADDALPAEGGIRFARNTYPTNTDPRCRLFRSESGFFDEKRLFHLVRGKYMNSKLMAASLAVALCGVGAASTNAATLAIILTDPTVNGGAPTTEDSGPSPLTVSGLTYGTFTVGAISGAASSSGPIFFGSTTLLLQSTTTPATLTVDVVEEGITSPLGTLDFKSGLTSNLLPAGWSVTEQTLYSAPTKQLAWWDFANIGTSTQNTAVSVVAPYAIDERYIISLGSGASSGLALSTITVSSSIPEASTWAMMGLGFAGLGLAALGRRRRTDLFQAL